jgi:hypothetical protein
LTECERQAAWGAAGTGPLCRQRLWGGCSILRIRVRGWSSAVDIGASSELTGVSGCWLLPSPSLAPLRGEVGEPISGLSFLPIVEGHLGDVVLRLAQPIEVPAVIAQEILGFRREEGHGKTSVAGAEDEHLLRIGGGLGGHGRAWADGAGICRWSGREGDIHALGSGRVRRGMGALPFEQSGLYRENQ